MRLHRLELAAFGPFADAQRVDFDGLAAAGLFLLHGPTGAGKTSVLDAVCYALYGTVPGTRQGSGLSLRSDHADPHTPTSVRLEFTAGGRRLEVTRRPEQPRPKKRGAGTTRDKALSTLREYDASANGGQWRALSRSHQEIGDELAQLLGMSREQFCQVVLLPQGDFARFLHAEDTARGRLLGQLFDTSRFAGVEERLAELRRAARARVAAGDERLMSLAHRMAQAAGDSVELRCRPLPDLTGGEPGLAEEVLAWAAVARADARERRDIGRLATLSAEARHTDARRAEEAAKELASAQRRHTLASRRADELADRGEEWERVAGRLAEARAAEAVAPAVDLWQAAESDHHAAVKTERDARAPLPDRWADTDAEGLAAAERHAREGLGALEAAGRAERRTARIDAELADLARQQRADTATAGETADWLAGWEATREAHQRRVEDARRAAGHAEQVAHRIDTVTARLDAARRRDTLTERADSAARETLRAQRLAGTARQHWLDLKERRLRGIAAELSAGLRPGQPCTVCGATEHPRPARAAADHVDRDTEEAAMVAAEEALGEQEAAERRERRLREELAAAAGEAAGAETAALTAELAEAHTSHGAARAEAADIAPAEEALAALDAEYQRRLSVRGDVERRDAARASRVELLARERDALDDEVRRARAGAASVAERVAALEREAALCGAAATAARLARDTAGRLRDAETRLTDAAREAGFADPWQAVRARLDRRQQTALQEKYDQWRAERAAVHAELADPTVRRAGQRAPADVAEAGRRRADATQALRAASARDAAAESRCADLDRLAEQLTEEARRLVPLRREHDRIAALATLTAGTAADNAHRMRLESYVLAARLEQVAVAATVRLRRMSAGRYGLTHSDARRAGRGRSGLGLRVVDAWTGRDRDTATLSGGETFLVSLALALGLADVVTAESGGARLETLFIDEGFGSLDEQTLDEVLDVLDSLRESDRAVGIVSHVADLRQRIPTQLEVVKSRSGSAVRHRATAVPVGDAPTVAPGR